MSRPVLAIRDKCLAKRANDDQPVRQECSCRDCVMEAGIVAWDDGPDDASAGQSHLKLDGARNQSIISSWIFVTKCQSD